MTTVFFDVDTQIDFLFPAGALYVPGSERLVPVFATLNHYAEAHGVIVVSDTDAHTEDDPEFKHWPPHCVAGTAGQLKPAQTLLDQRVVIPSTPGDYDISGAKQIVVQKQHLDVFMNPNIPALLEMLDADRYVAYGVVTEYCVRCAVMGLLRTGKPVELVTDAIETLNQDDARRTYDEVTAAGGKLTTVAEVCRE